MDKGLISDLLKTPSQIRKENDQRRLTEGLAMAQLAQQGNTLGGVGGMFANFGAQQAAQTGRNISNAFRGVTDAIGTVTGADLRPADERAAGQAQNIMRGVDMSNPESMLKAAERLQASNPQAAEALTAKAQEIIKTQKSAEAVAAQQEFENKLATEEAGRDADELQLQKNQLSNILGIEVDDATVESQAEARNIITKGRQEGETASQLLNRSRNALQTLDKTVSTTVNVGGEGETAFDKKLGTIDAEAYSTSVTQMDNVDRSLNTITEAKQLLDEGIYSGFGGQLKLDISRAKKFFNLADASEQELIERTETYQRNMANATLAVLGSGDLGGGTGLSDKDRDFAQAVVGGEISLDERSLARIIDINERANVYRVKQHNQLVQRNNKRYNENLEYRYYEGQTATHPDTGETLVFSNGSWPVSQGGSTP